MRVVFMGNHTVGVRTLNALRQSCDVTGVIAHPEDAEDGVRYESVYDFANEQGLTVERLQPTDERFQAFVRQANPDLIWLTDYRYIIPKQTLEIPRHGTVNLHPSLLPEYRGRAPLNWAIINGESRLGLTAHFVSEAIDAGDIIAQRSFELTPDEDVGNALEKLYPMYADIAAQVLDDFNRNVIKRTPQPSGDHKVYPRRRPEDGWIDWRESARNICNLVRGVARPYPGAFGFVGERRVTIWKCAVEERDSDASAGTIVDIGSDGSIRIACGGGTFIALDYSMDHAHELEVADRFELEHRTTASVG
ncbi:MAG: methionyl-tRNA formyltransferase [Phycisphaerae bacterium]